MPMDRFLIGPVSVGLQTDLKPFLIPDEAYASLNNAYVFRGRVRKRFGSLYMGPTQLNSRLRIALTQPLIALAGGAGFGTTDGDGNAAGDVPGGIYQVGQGFVIGNIRYGVVSGAAGPQPMAQYPYIPTPTATYNVGTGAYNFVGAPINTQIYFYNNQPLLTDGLGDATGIVPGNRFGIGQAFSVGTTIFTVVTTGVNQPMLSTGITSAGIYSTTNGAFTIDLRHLLPRYISIQQHPLWDLDFLK